MGQPFLPKEEQGYEGPGRLGEENLLIASSVNSVDHLTIFHLCLHQCLTLMITTVFNIIILWSIEGCMIIYVGRPAPI